ncbi:hypothetical protein CYMTET_39143 [Cymbomonas tetramitiformis]|uniref:Uncharacterized protein n=1 Tax=Cymbomonas tetramitiformis TaxID=36881 RepID=A0AAE0CC02_9CHLO|nr:hypothetical protein CYMTET_39143 [Cymbomonas tetramitiformis]
MGCGLTRGAQEKAVAAGLSDHHYKPAFERVCPEDNDVAVKKAHARAKEVEREIRAAGGYRHHHRKPTHPCKNPYIECPHAFDDWPSPPPPPPGPPAAPKQTQPSAAPAQVASTASARITPMPLASSRCVAVPEDPLNPHSNPWGVLICAPFLLTAAVAAAPSGPHHVGRASRAQ